MSVYWRRCSGHTILTTQSRALTFRKCVDVWVTFKNDPNNHRRDTQKPAENYISLADTNLLICPLLHRDNRAFILIFKRQYSQSSMYRPVMGLEQAVQRLENSCAKQSAQYGMSSREVNLGQRNRFTRTSNLVDNNTTTKSKWRSSTSGRPGSCCSWCR